ncbi:putative bifunctional diguanylate cyclase/phosphodiesterase [Legionella saoudiensis]|uniref:putative bifunctional diguanylate cyclase/phosphodiesterase n=1 Tax=Legionella saoudiensis TaxID=1750561 RepID=UPI0007301A96|nr:GGDEF domain-containing phosphodiesterase [Legionella saoudiensis]
MSKPLNKHTYTKTPQLTLSEQREIDKKIAFETSFSFHSMVKLGAFANIIGAFLYILALYHSPESRLSIYWYFTLVAANLLNVMWGLRFEYSHITLVEIHKCRKGFLYLLVAICLIWGSIGVLFMDGPQQQLTTIIFLSAVLICFTFSTSMDLTMGLSSIACLLAPTILYHFYAAFFLFPGAADNHRINMPITAAFLMLGLFMAIACFIGNKIILQVVRLGYENELLMEKLASMNAILEQRVRERTEELETSLKLVTYQATHDLLTELPNERLLYEQIHLATENALNKHYSFAIACFSLNGMIKINDSIGHQAAATIIHRIAQRFALLFGKNNQYFISLLRQDVFVILIDAISDELDISTSVHDFFAVIKDPVYVAKQELKLTASIGVSIFPINGRDADTLITNAEAARVLAAQSGGNSVRIYSTMINADATRQLNIENQLYRAIEKNELTINYQPFIDLETGRICGAEALLRWKNPILGNVSPVEFIPIAEMNNMIIPIGEWVLRTACLQLKKWQKSGFKNFKMSVNLSARQLAQQNLVECIAEILATQDLDPKYLELELTESEAFKNEAIPIINKFREMGISLAIDDFGTGYSEFSNLKLFKVDQIKIDKSFIQDIDVSVDSRNIVCNTIALANSMEIKCLAEGVETIEQVQFLKENGCHIMQGFYFSEPLEPKEFFKLLKKYSKRSHEKLLIVK